MEVLQSKGKPFTDPFVYLGTGGTIYMYYRLYHYAVRTQQTDLANNYIGKAVEAFQITNHVMSKIISQRDHHSPSFFMGPAGVYTLGALIYSHIDDKKGSNVDKYLEKVLSFTR